MGNVNKIKKLAEILSNMEGVRRYNDSENEEAWTLAHGLYDIEESSKRISEKITFLLESNEKSDLNDNLLDIGEELRHILYHINDMRFYSYLIEKQ